MNNYYGKVMTSYLMKFYAGFSPRVVRGVIDTFEPGLGQVTAQDKQMREPGHSEEIWSVELGREKEKK